MMIILQITKFIVQICPSNKILISFNIVGNPKEPRENTFGTRYQWKTVHGKRKLVEIKDTFQYIPLLDVLQAMLNNDSIFKEVQYILLFYIIIIIIPSLRTT